jgi:hypothetical protein
MPAIKMFRGQHPQEVRRGCKGLKPQQHTQAGYQDEQLTSICCAQSGGAAA